MPQMTPFGALAFQAAQDQYAVDRNALLISAADFLDRALAGDPVALPLQRHLAAKALDFAVIGPPAYDAFMRSFNLYCLFIDMKQQDS